MKPINNHINYVEFKASNIDVVKAFYTKTFGWKFTDYGANYIAFEGSGVEGGFEKTNEVITNGALVVLYHDNLEDVKQHVLHNGAKLSVDIFSFPGGRRFQFFDPSGNELAVWCHEK